MLSQCLKYYLAAQRLRSPLSRSKIIRLTALQKVAINVMILSIPLGTAAFAGASFDNLRFLILLIVTFLTCGACDSILFYGSRSNICPLRWRLGQMLWRSRYAIDHVQFVDITIKSTDIEFILLIYAKGRNVKACVCKLNVHGNARAVIP